MPNEPSSRAAPQQASHGATRKTYLEPSDSQHYTIGRAGKILENLSVSRCEMERVLPSNSVSSGLVLDVHVRRRITE
jgi:hypothetical protein